MDPSTVLSLLFTLAQKLYFQCRQMSANSGTADTLSARIKLIEDRLGRIATQPLLVERNHEACAKIYEVFCDAAALVSEALAAPPSTTFYIKMVTTARRFLKAGTYEEQFVELGYALDQATATLQVV